MKKLLFFIALPFMFLTLSAQITQEQADAIVLQYIQNEVFPPYILYVNTHAPTAEGIVINTFKEETVKVKYPCWSYYLNENPSVSAPCQHRYLLVKEDDGNLLEIITTNDLGPEELLEWEVLLHFGITDVKENSISIYPNPTTGKLTIDNGELRIENVEIFDIYGKCHLSLVTRHETSVTRHSSHVTLNISHLSAGLYFVKISNEAGMVVKKVIKQ